MITKDSIETAYSFLHQKRRSTSGRLLPTGRKNVYIHSSLDWQKDDIEYAIASYASVAAGLTSSVTTNGFQRILHKQ